MLVMVIVVMIIMNVVNINGMTRKTIIIGISEFEIKTQKECNYSIMNIWQVRNNKPLLTVYLGPKRNTTTGSTTY